MRSYISWQPALRLVASIALAVAAFSGARLASGQANSSGSKLKSGAKAKAKAKAEAQADPRLNAALAAIRQKHDVAALAAAIVSDQGLVAVGAVGARKRGEAAQVTVNDKFHLGSDTKTMTAAMIARLVESGKLKWDTPLAKLFPGEAASMAPEIAQATLVHVLTHHLGVPDDGNALWGLHLEQGEVRDKRRKVARRLLASKPTDPPGTKFAYANSNLILAASLAESTTGKSWEELMQTGVFQPLAMSTAGFGPMSPTGSTEQPWAHEPNGTPVDPKTLSWENAPLIGPAGNVHTSLPDWSKFIADQLRAAAGGRSLFKPQTCGILFQPPFEKEGYVIAGWQLTTQAQDPVLTHAGSDGHNFAFAYLYPAKGQAILVATNQGGPNGPGQRACEEAVQVLQNQLIGR